MLNFDDAANTSPWAEANWVDALSVERRSVERLSVETRWIETLCEELWVEVSTVQAAQIQGGSRRTPVVDDFSQSLGVGLIAEPETSTSKKKAAQSFDPTVIFSIFSAFGNIGGAGMGNQGGRNQTAGAFGSLLSGFGA